MPAGAGVDQELLHGTRVRRPATRLPGGIYAGGVKFLLVVIVLGVLVYLLVRVVQRRGFITPSGRRVRAAPPQQRRMIAPDDDPDFLRDLDRKRKHNHQDDTDT